MQIKDIHYDEANLSASKVENLLRRRWRSKNNGASKFMVPATLSKAERGKFIINTEVA
jgi:hypothetical protein